MRLNKICTTATRFAFLVTPILEISEVTQVGDCTRFYCKGLKNTNACSRALNNTCKYCANRNAYERVIENADKLFKGFNIFLCSKRLNRITHKFHTEH